MTCALSASYCLSASMALSALPSVTTPTAALAMRMRRMTPGSMTAWFVVGVYVFIGLKMHT